ncbi:MAG TPA: TlpA disulfide reductase family protein [Pyrinomonadaceae bacterium]|jgi:cytochrome c biogenesis protein CcmG/thiol:disulfide interchange protein DsbE|nr:TlpA disulfide reductase family protein [Pyrinomonadaceae bacterium]
MPAQQKTNTGKSLWTPTRIAFTILVLSLVAAFGISSCSSNDEKRTAPPAPVAGPNNAPPPARNAAPAPVVTLPPSVVDAELRAVTGAPIKLSSYAGKVLLVNLWATWCGPCRLETPELIKLHKEFSSQGVEMVGLSTENPDASADAVRQFIQDFEVDYRIGWATPEVAVTLMQGRDAIPQSFIISRNGRVVKRFVGFNPMMTPPQIREALQEALNDKGAAD